MDCGNSLGYVHLKSVHSIICKLYLNLKKKKGSKDSSGELLSPFYLYLDFLGRQAQKIPWLTDPNSYLLLRSHTNQVTSHFLSLVRSLLP